MKLKYFILPAMLVLVGAGCEQSRPVAIQQPQIIEKIVQKECPPQEPQKKNTVSNLPVVAYERGGLLAGNVEEMKRIEKKFIEPYTICNKDLVASILVSIPEKVGAEYEIRAIYLDGSFDSLMFGAREKDFKSFDCKSQS